MRMELWRMEEKMTDEQLAEMAVEVYGSNGGSWLAVVRAIRAELGWQPIAEAPDTRQLHVGRYANNRWSEWRIDALDGAKSVAIEFGYTHYLPDPEPPAREGV